MNKILLIARREFVATVSTKGFLVGLFAMPAIVALSLVVGPRLMTARSPQVVGSVGVIDPTGRVLPMLRSTLSPAAIEARQAENAKRAAAIVPGAARVVQRAAGTVPNLTLVERPAGADLSREKQRLTSEDPSNRWLALLVVHGNAVEPAGEPPEFGSFDLYASRGLTDATESVLFDSMREALVTARLGAAQLDRSRVETMTRVTRPESMIVSAEGERRAQRQFTALLPFMFGLLLFVAVLVGGQTLMTSTIEEKSSRVVEVLLAAISPFQLMAGKLIGQLGVGLLAMAIYLALGVLSLYSFAMLGLLDPLLVVYFLVFFLITYVVFAALMMAIGAAVNEMAEAGSLMTPVMMLLVLPYMFSPMVGRAPNSTVAVVLSFLPPVNAFAMMTRLASDSPPPAWQVWLTAALGIGAAVAAVWFAAKVFKIGLLMHGKPPNLATLVRWAREA